MLLLVSSIKINLLLIDPEMLTSGSSKAKFFTKTLLRTQSLVTEVSLYLLFLLELIFQWWF